MKVTLAGVITVLGTLLESKHVKTSFVNRIGCSGTVIDTSNDNTFLDDTPHIFVYNIIIGATKY